MKNFIKVCFLLIVLNLSVYGVDNIQQCLKSYDECISECEEKDGCMSEQMDCMDLCRDRRDRCLKKTSIENKKDKK